MNDKAYIPSDCVRKSEKVGVGVGVCVSVHTYLIVLFQALPVRVPLVTAFLADFLDPAVSLYIYTHRSCAQRVTLRPSLRQCSGSRFSFLHSIKSSAYG